MSPEQPQRKLLDKRTDISSFAVVPYEMLAGKPAFAGESIADILAAGQNASLKPRRRVAN